jgi:hypothetical protein
MKITAIIGICKNSGKTSFLNSVIPNAVNMGITSTGRDGEEIDLVHGSVKPKITIPQGAYYTAFEHSVYAPDSEIIQKLPFRVIGKHIYLIKALNTLETEIVGPATLNEQDELIDIFRDYGCENIYIDGAIDRKAICLSTQIDEIVLVVGASFGSVNDIIKETLNLLNYTQFTIFDIAKYESITYKTDEIVQTGINSVYSNETEIMDIINKNPEWLYFPGALTEISYQKMKKSFNKYAGQIIFEHPLNCQISNTEQCFYSRLGFPIKKVAVNSFSSKNAHIDASILRNKIRTNIKGIEIVDITELRL